MISVASAEQYSVNRRVLSAAIAVMVATVIVKLAATAKEFTVAGVFGRSDAVEAYLAAALIPGLLINLIAESMNQALLPTLVRVRQRDGSEQAQQLLSSSLFSTSIMLAVVSIAMACLARSFFPLIASHFNPEKLSLAIKLFYGLEPVIVLTGIASICTSVLNSTGAFAVPALAPIVTPIAFLIFVPLFASRFGVWAMVYATVAGALLQVIWVGSMMNGRGYRLRFRWYGINEATRQVAQQFWPAMLSGLVSAGGLLVDQSMAAMLPAGSVSALAYAGRFVGVALALLGGAVSAALTPSFSEMIARSDWRECRRTMRTWAWGSAAVAALVAVVLILSSRILVRLTFQHGVFSAQDTSAVSYVLVMYAMQIPFFVSSRVFYRFLVAMRRTDLVLYCGLLNLALDVVLNILLMHWLGVAGIALATSLWAVSTLIFLDYWSWRVLRAADAGVPNRVA